MLGNLIACTHATTVTLCKVGRSPGCIQMMDSHTPFLCVHTRSEHTCRAEQHTHRTFVHGGYHRFACLLVLAFLNEADFRSGYAVILRQLTLDFGIDIPSVTRLIGSQIREDELRSLLCIVLVVVFRYHLGTMACLVVGMVFVLVFINHTHIQRHLTGIVRSYEHLRLFLRFG